MFFICLIFWVYTTAVCLTLCFSSIQFPLFGQQPVVGPASRHFCRAYITYVSVRVSRGCLQSTVLEWKCWMCVSVCTYECIWQLLDLLEDQMLVAHAWHLSIVYTSIRTHGRFTNVYDRICFLFVHFYEHARQLSAHTHAHTQRSLAHTWELWWWRVWRWFAVAPQTIIHTCMHICMHVYLSICFCLLAFMSIHDSCLPNSLFLLDTRLLYLEHNQLSALQPGSFANLTSLRWVFVFLVAVYRVLCLSESVEGVCMCVYAWVYMTAVWPVYAWVYMTAVWPRIKCLLHMDSTSALSMQASGHTDVHAQTDRLTQWMDWRNSRSTRTRTCSARSHTLEMRVSCGGHMHAHVHVHACVLIIRLFPFLSVKTQSDLYSTNVYERRQSYIHTYILVTCLYEYVYIFFVCSFLPLFLRFNECVCFSWLFTGSCTWEWKCWMCVSVCTYECIWQRFAHA
jgi:hypothetical protein